MRKFLAIINLPHTTASRFRQVSVSLSILRKNKLLKYNNKYCPWLTLKWFNAFFVFLIFEKHASRFIKSFMNSIPQFIWRYFQHWSKVRLFKPFIKTPWNHLQLYGLQNSSMEKHESSVYCTDPSPSHPPWLWDGSYSEYQGSSTQCSLLAVTIVASIEHTGTVLSAQIFCLTWFQLVLSPGPVQTSSPLLSEQKMEILLTYSEVSWQHDWQMIQFSKPCYSTYKFFFTSHL